MTKIKSNIGILRAAVKTDGVTMVLSVLKKNGHAASFWDHDGPEVWIQWLESSIKGAGAVAMRKLIAAADKTNTMLRGSVTDDYGNGKLFDYYKSFGFVVDPAGGEIMERQPISGCATATHVIDSPEFKEWFGGSQVVDDNGKPLVVYHGTASDFSKFEVKHVGKSTCAAWCHMGYFFTPDKELASNFTKGKNWNKANARTKLGGHVIPVYLSLQNPMRVPASRLLPISGSIDKVRSIRLEAEALGHDGIIIGTFRDSFDFDDTTDELNQPQYIAFNPLFIKSALGNCGIFDRNDPNICA